jgi:hypothetical protein
VNKNQKALKYENWGDAEEKWLIISASGGCISNRAGPPINQSIWDDAALLALSQSSPFDRILFSARSDRWYKWLKPAAPVRMLRE